MAKHITYQIHNISASGPVFIFGTHKPSDASLEGNDASLENKNTKMLASIVELCAGFDFRLVTYEVEDWQGQFSPWADGRLSNEYTGKGEETVQFLKDELLPVVREKYGDSNIYLLGYSLAGMFSLWAMDQIEGIAGAASCSGSLWYPGFLEYEKEKSQAAGKNIYISLGGKESKTNDLFMQIVDECTKDIVDVLKERNNVKFEMNPGGHFASVDKRIAKAIKWIAETDR